MIAPVVIVVCICLYYIGIGIYFSYMDGAPQIAKILALIIPAVIIGISVTVLVERIKEIKKGEDDDLSKY